MKEPAHLALHPFGQIPTYEEGALALFESGAFIFHIAERYAGLLPNDANARARAAATNARMAANQTEYFGMPWNAGQRWKVEVITILKLRPANLDSVIEPARA
jgi:glutathione S-transferase